MTRTRRQFAGLLAAPLLRAAPESPGFIDYSPAFTVDVQESNPRVKAFDLRKLTEWETPAAQFFTFHQTRTVTAADLSQWRLEIAGAVARPRTFTYEELTGFPAKTVPAVIECAGNTGHAKLMNGLVSNGVWTGPLLAPLLRECGLLPEAREVVFFGADIERERKWPAGDREFTAPHGRSLFVQDAMEGNVVLALHLNRKPLPQEHGYPLRLVVPGWYGMTQIKWLNRIVVLDRRYEGRHMARNYHSVRATGPNGEVLETSISRNRLKSVIARIERNEGYSVFGAAWGGSNMIDRVEVRIDGKTIREAAFVRRSGPEAWSLWELDWRDATPGVHTLVSRAIDARGQVQPERTLFASSREDNSQWTRRVVIPAK